MSLLSIISEISRTLLNSPEANLGLERSLSFLGEELSLGCIRITKNGLNDETEKVSVYTFYEWFVSEEVKKSDTYSWSDFSYDEIFEVFASTLGIGKPLYRNTLNDLTYKNGVGELYRKNGLKSIFIAPIFLNSNHWGNLSFLDYTNERNWEDIEDELMIVCGMISAFIKNVELKESFGQELCTSHSVKMATLGEMASGIAHEINNPLFVINGYASKINASIDRERLDVHELRNISKMIQKNCKRVTSIISGLRLISRKSKLDELEVRNFKEILESTIDISKERIRLASIELTSHMDIDDDVLIECLPEQISQVLVNLLNNSHDSLVEMNGDKWIKFNLKELEDRLIFSITDSGKKVSPEISKNMMQPFYTTKDSGKGTGLGLSISKEIIQKHGGKFYVDEHCENMKLIIELPTLSYE